MRKHARKTALLLMLLLFLPAVLTGCHGSRSRTAFIVPESFDTEKRYELTFWAKNDTNLTQKAIYEKAIRDFESMYPNVTVNMRLYTDYGRIYNDVITNISTDTTPNICITYPDHIATYLTGADVVVPLDDLFAHKKYGFAGSELRFDGPKQEEVVPEFLEECIVNGFYYAVPYMRSTEACYVNKTYVEKLGYTLPETLTWDFVWEVSEAAMAKNADGTFKVNGQKTMIPFIYKSTDNMMIQMLHQKQAGYSQPDGTVEIFNDTTRDILKEIAAHAGTGAFSTFKISSYPANFLNAGQCIFAVDSTAGATWMGSDAPLADIAEEAFVDFETEVMTVPQYDPAHIRMISQGPSMCIFNKEDPQEVLASWLFTQFMLTNGVQIAYSETEGYVPVTVKARASEEYQTYIDLAGTDTEEHYDIKIRAAQLLNGNTENTFTTPVFNGSASLRDASGQMIEEVTKSVRRKKTVNDAFIHTLFENMTSLYRLDQIVPAGAKTENGQELGPLPGGAKALLGSLAAAWCGIGAVYAVTLLKSKKKAK